MSLAHIKHIFLTQADNRQQARRNVLVFLERTELIRYEATTIQEAAIKRADMASFWSTLDQAVAQNRRIAQELIVELQETGVEQLSRLVDLPQGYPSKVLHTLVHILDGFIGVDSAFYNLLEDSHWLSAGLRQSIKERPARYWLIPVVPGKLQYSVFHQ